MYYSCEHQSVLNTMESRSIERYMGRQHMHCYRTIANYEELGITDFAKLRFKTK